MFVLGVGGCSSGVGKTALICRLLETWPEWGVIKTSPWAGSGGCYLVEESLAQLNRPGSDTERYLTAGAQRVVWLRHAAEALPVGIEDALGRCAGCPAVMVEGTSFALCRRPSRLLLVARAGFSEIKPSAHAVLAAVDFVVLNRAGHGDRALVADSRTALERLVGNSRLIEADIAGTGDPGVRRLLEAVRAWSRSRS